MRILILTKRQYTGKDLLDDRYGRLFELPEQLQLAGHEVKGIALSYRRRPPVVQASPGGVEWQSVNAIPGGIVRYGQAVRRMTCGWKPDVIWASSDAAHAVLAKRLSRRLAVPYVLDLYDNYESFGITQVPGVRRAFRDACRNASAITVVTELLRSKVLRDCSPRGEVEVVGNGINPTVFHPRDQRAARRRLGLPERARIIGTAGAITAGRGIDDLFRAFGLLAAQDDDLWLAYAGPRDGVPRRFPHPRSLDLGLLPQSSVADLFASLDVAVVCNRDSEFGRFCYPMKLAESLACGVPVVAARVGEAAVQLAGQANALYVPGDAEDLARKISGRLQVPAAGDAGVAQGWGDLAQPLERVLRRACQ